jgi:hypothetical protein
LGLYIVCLVLALVSAFACSPEPRESSGRERYEARVRRLRADRSTPLCRLPATGDTTGWRRVPTPDALLTVLLPHSFVALTDSPPRFWHGGYTWRDGEREFVEIGRTPVDSAPAGACRTYLHGVPIAYVTVSKPGQPTRVSASLAGLGGLYDSDLRGTSPDSSDRDLFLRVITTARYDTTFFRRQRGRADSARARY